MSLQDIEKQVEFEEMVEQLPQMTEEAKQLNADFQDLDRRLSRLKASYDLESNIGRLEQMSLFTSDWIVIETALFERSSILFHTAQVNAEREKFDKADAQWAEAELCDRLAIAIGKVINKAQKAEEELF